MASGSSEVFGNRVISLQEYQNNGYAIQYYAKLWDTLPKGESWTDGNFPPSISLIVGDAALENAKRKAGPGFVFEFKRAKDIVKNPVFLKDNIGSGKTADRFDILQGGVGDCWFMAAINAVVEKEPLFKMVVPEDNKFDERGIFHFRFWKCGVWVEVVVDDWLLCKTSEAGDTTLAFARNRDNELWVPLLEKAYAKLYGTYSDIHFGFPSDGLIDLTGGIFNILEISQDTYKDIVEALERGSIVCLGKNGIEGKPPEYVLENGLVTSHCYSVTGIKKVSFKGKPVTLLSIRNSYADHEWNGAWSDGDQNWNEINADVVSRLALDKLNGEFWMDYEDVCANFSSVYTCLLSNPMAQRLARPGVQQKYWESHSLFGYWRESVSVGIEDIAANEQFIVTVQGDDKTKVQIILGVYNKAIRLTGKDPIPEENKVYIYKILDSFNCKTSLTFSADDLKNPTKLKELKTTDPNSFFRDAVDYLELDSGSYLLIPVYGRTRGYPGEYCIRVFTDAKSAMQKLSNTKEQMPISVCC